MQVHCQNCHRPFAIGKSGVHDALDLLTRDELIHYNAYCPHCRRANRVSKKELLRAAPDWEYQEEKEET